MNTSIFNNLDDEDRQRKTNGDEGIMFFCVTLSVVMFLLTDRFVSLFGYIYCQRVFLVFRLTGTKSGWIFAPEPKLITV